MRRIIYGLSLWLFLLSAALTLSSVLLPSWITYTSPSSTSSSPIRITYGLHKRCSSLTGSCTPFPQRRDCHADDAAFCALWRSTGFLMNLAVVLEGAGLVTYVTVLAGGRAAREGGWRVLSGVLGIAALGQLVAMALVAYLYDHDARFFVGWSLDTAWILCTISWSVLVVNVAGLISAALFMPPEDDYEPIHDPM